MFHLLVVAEVRSRRCISVCSSLLLVNRAGLVYSVMILCHVAGQRYFRNWPQRDWAEGAIFANDSQVQCQFLGPRSAAACPHLVKNVASEETAWPSDRLQRHAAPRLGGRRRHAREWKHAGEVAELYGQGSLSRVFV